MFWVDLCVSNLHFPPKKDVVKGIKGPCKNKLQTQPWALSHSLSHSPMPFILRVPLDPAGAGPWQELWFVYSGYPSMSLIVVLNVDIKWFHVKISWSSAKPWGKEKNVWLLTSPYLGKKVRVIYWKASWAGFKNQIHSLSFQKLCLGMWSRADLLCISLLLESVVY